jgi:hypothetical protein
VEIAIDLDDRFLCCVLGIRFVAEQRQEQKINCAFARPDQIVKDMLLSRLNPANAFSFEFRVGNDAHDPIEERENPRSVSICAVVNTITDMDACANIRNPQDSSRFVKIHY